jgi:hypothetical protein
MPRRLGECSRPAGRNFPGRGRRWRRQRRRWPARPAGTSSGTKAFAQPPGGLGLVDQLHDTAVDTVSLRARCSGAAGKAESRCRGTRDRPATCRQIEPWQRLTDTVGYAELAGTLDWTCVRRRRTAHADFAGASVNVCWHVHGDQAFADRPCACRPRRRPAGRRPPFSANARARGEHHAHE